MLLTKKIGILGGGQLAKMLCGAAQPLLLDIHVLDPNVKSPASHVAVNFQSGSFKDKNEVLSFAKDLDVITIEIEDVSIEALKVLKAQGKEVYPKSSTIEKIKDKGLQKTVYDENDIPTASFALVNDKQELLEFVRREQWSFPFIAKLRVGGYDGRGVFKVDDMAELNDLPDVPFVLEKIIDIKHEVSVIVARNTVGQTTTYPPVRMVFDPVGNLLDYLTTDHLMTEDQQSVAKDLAIRLAEIFDVVGLLAVEMFIDQEDRIWINEVAPRPHNSGHHTIEAFNYSQYDMHWRSILGIDLPEPSACREAAMINLLGEPGYFSKPIYAGLEDVLSQPNTFVHIYGKDKTRPLRKMGHMTILADDTETLRTRITEIKGKLKVISK